MFFSDESDRDLRFSGYILPFEYGFHTRFNSPPDISCDVFSMFDAKHKLDIELIAFTEEDGLKICRELNGHWRNDMRYIGFAEKGIYIKKTLKSMMKQLDNFMYSEYMVDPKTQIIKDFTDDSNNGYDAISWLDEDSEESSGEKDEEETDE